MTSVTKAVVKVIRNGEAWERDGGNTRGVFRTNIRSVGFLLHFTLLGIHIKVFVMEKVRQLMDTTDNRQENGVKTCTAAALALSWAQARPGSGSGRLSGSQCRADTRH